MAGIEISPGSAAPLIPLNPPQQTNMLDNLTKLTNLQNTTNQNQLFQQTFAAKQAQAKAAAAATDEKGNFDYPTYLKVLSSTPQGAWATPEAANQATVREGTQLENKQKELAALLQRQTALSSTFAPLVNLGPNVTRADLMKAAAPLISDGHFSASWIIPQINAMPEAGPELAKQISVYAQQSEQGRKTLEQALGNIMPVSQGDRTALLGVNKSTGEVTNRGTVGMNMSPEQQSAMVPFNDATGTPKLAPRSQFGGMSGSSEINLNNNGLFNASKGLVSERNAFTDAKDAYGIAARQTRAASEVASDELGPRTQAPATAPVPPQGVPQDKSTGLTRPEGVTAGPNILQTTYQKGVGDNAVKYESNLNDTVQSQSEVIKQIGEMRTALAEARTGGGSDWRQWIGEKIQAIPGFPKEWADQVGGQDSKLHAMQTFEKYAAQYAASLLNGVVSRVSGSHLNESMWDTFYKNNPHLDMDANAIESMLNFASKQYGWNKQEQDAYFAKKKTDGVNFNPTTWPKDWQDQMIAKGIIKPETVTGEALGSGAAPLGTKPKAPPVRKSVVPGKAPTKSVEEWLGLPAAGAQ